jgi:hypothetical protein
MFSLLEKLNMKRMTFFLSTIGVSCAGFFDPVSSKFKTNANDLHPRGFGKLQIREKALRGR